MIVLTKKYFALTSASIIFVAKIFLNMDKQLLIQQKQKLMSLEADEKTAFTRLKAKKLYRNIGITMFVIGIVSFIISIDVFAFIILTIVLGGIGLPLWIAFGIATRKAKAVYDITLSEITEIKKQILVTENS